MRELKRSIARARMRDQGLAHINKKTIELTNKEGKGTGVKVSFFSKYWRSYVNHYIDPESYKAEGAKDRKISKQAKSRFFRNIRRRIHGGK